MMPQIHPIPNTFLKQDSQPRTRIVRALIGYRAPGTGEHRTSEFHVNVMQLGCTLNLRKISADNI